MEGTLEVIAADFNGTATTIMVLIPILLIGGYVQTILKPFASVLIIALISSFFVSVTVIPLLAPFFLGGRRYRIELWMNGLSDSFVRPIQAFFVGLLKMGLRHRFLFLFIGGAAFVASMIQMKTTIGRDLMPPMDTGIVKVAFETENNRSLEASEKILFRIESKLKELPGVFSISSTLGFEPGVISFGSGKSPQEGMITVNMVDRFHRKKSIWEIEAEIRKKAQEIEGLKYLHAYDFGATPLSTILAPVGVMLSGPDSMILDQLANEVFMRLTTVPGFTSLSRTWDRNKTEIQLVIDPLKARYYGMDPFIISQQVGIALRGAPASIFRIPNEDGMTMRVRYPYADRSELGRLNQMYITTPKRELIPLKLMAHFQKERVQSLITHRNLFNVVNIRATGQLPRLPFCKAGLRKF